MPPSEPDPKPDEAIPDSESVTGAPAVVRELSRHNPHARPEGTRQPGRLWVIVNYIPPYMYEIAGILGAIAGAKTRFRFQSKYVQPAALNPTGSGLSEVVICMRNRDSGAIIPLRWGELRSWRWIAGIAVFDVELKSLATLPDSPAARQQYRLAFTTWITQEMEDFDNSGGQDLKKLVYVSRRLEDSLQRVDSDSPSHDTRWANLLSEIEEQFPDPRVDFVLVSAPRTSREVPIASTVEDGTRGVRVVQGEQYHLEITQRTHTSKKGDSTIGTESTVLLSSESPDILIPQPQHAIKGKYSDVELYFSVSREAPPGPRHASLVVTRRGSSPAEYEMELPLVVTRNRGRGALSALSLALFALGLAAYLAPHAFAGALEAMGHFISLGVPPSDETIEKAAVVVMIAASMGNPMTRWLGDRLKVG